MQPEVEALLKLQDDDLNAARGQHLDRCGDVLGITAQAIELGDD